MRSVEGDWKGERLVNVSERDLEDYIFEHPWVIDCDEMIARQVRTSEGIIDLVGLRRNDDGEPTELVVVELKLPTIDHAAVAQLQRYIWALEAGRQLHVGHNREEELDLPLKGILVGNGATKEAKYLCSACHFEIYSYETKLIVECKQIWHDEYGPNLAHEVWQQGRAVYESLMDAVALLDEEHEEDHADDTGAAD